MNVDVNSILFWDTGGFILDCMLHFDDQSFMGASETRRKECESRGGVSYEMESYCGQIVLRGKNLNPVVVILMEWNPTVDKKEFKTRRGVSYGIEPYWGKSYCGKKENLNPVAVFPD